LEARVAERVGQGQTLSDIMREALEAYFGLPPAQVLDTRPGLSDMSDTLSDMRARLAQLEARLDELGSGVGQRPTACPTPAPPPATPESPPAVPAHVERIAEFAAEYSRLSLGELAQELHTRGIYSATDRHTGESKPVNRGTLTRWLEQARQAGLL